MDTNVIKEYLIGLGFKVNSDSLNQAKQSISGVEGTLKNFANNNKDNMSSMQGFFKSFSNSMKDNLGIVSKILPEAKLPFLQIISFAELLYKGVDKVSQGFKNVNSDKLKDTQTDINKTSNVMQDLSKNTEEVSSSVVQFMELVKLLNTTIDSLSTNFGNINLDKLNETNVLQNFSEKEEEAQSSVVNLIALVKEFNGAINKIGINSNINISEDIFKTSAAMKNLTKESENSIEAFQSLKNIGEKLKSNPEEIKKASMEIKDFSKNTEKSHLPVAKLITLVKEFSDSISHLSQKIGNVKLNIEPKNINNDSNEIEDLNEKSNNLIKTLESLNKISKELDTKQIKNASNEMQGFSGNAEEAQSSLIQLINLVKGLNNASNNLSKNIGNIRFNIDSENINNVSGALDDISKKGSDSTKTLENLDGATKKLDSKQVENISEKMQGLCEKTKEVKSPIVQLIELITNLNKVKIDNKPKNIPSSNPRELPKHENISKSNADKSKITESVPKEIGKVSDAMKGLDKESSNAINILQLLKNNGGKAITEFAEIAGVSLSAIAAGFATLVAVGVGAWKALESLANQDLGYQKLAMQLWTTKENAKEIDMALKTMKVSMQDLWLSPELLQQFNQLRHDSAQLKLPSDYENNLKVVRNIIFEFQRLKQAGTLAFQWIGYYIAKYAAGPLANLHESLKSFTDWMLKNIPGAAKVIGTVLGAVFRLFLVAIEAISIAIQSIIDIIQFVIQGFEKLPAPIQNLIKLIALIGAAIMLGPWAAIVGLLLILDDLFTYVKGGHSVIGSFFDYLKKQGTNAIDSVKEKFKSIKNGLMEPINYIKDGWNKFWKGIENFIDKIEAKFKKLENDIKNSALGKTIGAINNGINDAKDKIKGTFSWGIKNTPEAQAAIKDFSSKLSAFSTNRSVQLPSYLMPQSTTNKTSNSSVSNDNKVTNNFNIYGTNPTGTANAISSKINNGIKTRNLQGVI